MAAILEQAEVATELRPAIAGRNPWLLAGRRLWHNRIAMAALVLFLLIVVTSLLAPLYASDIAHTNPFVNNLNGTTIVHGKRVPLMQQGGGRCGWARPPSAPPGTCTTISWAPTRWAATWRRGCSTAGAAR